MRTIANTGTNIYFDTPAVRKDCDRDFKVIARACKPESDRKPQKKSRGITGKISSMTEKLDRIGRKGYRRTRDNAWMDDHCSGLWLKPRTNKPYSQDELSALRESIENLDVGILDQLSLVKGSMGDMLELAYEVLPRQQVMSIARRFGMRTGAKTVVGIVGSPSGLIPAAMAAWTISDIISTASTLAGMMGDKGAQALKAMETIGDLSGKAQEFVKDLVENPAKAHTNFMSLLALMDSCLRARKCRLVPFSQTTDNTPHGGQGCCPGQTGHHLIPGSAARDSCNNYNHNSAPVMCLEGTSNNKGWGTHGNAHAKLKKLMDEYRGEESDNQRSPNRISYDDMASNAVDAVRESGAAAQCDKACLLAQLKAYYNCPNDMPPKDGTGRMSKMDEPAPAPTSKER